MGLFSSKKKISVGSTMYNLAGDIDKRIQYLPTTINTKIIAHTPATIGETIQDSMIRGPGMRMRSYARWARTSGYNNRIRFQSGQLSTGNSIDMATIIDSIPHAEDEDVVIQTADIGLADYGYWADQWMLENHPDQVDAGYVIDFNEEDNLIEILFGDVVTYSFAPTNFVDYASYLYVSYLLVKRNQIGTLLPGTETQVPSEDDLPSVADYALVDTVEEPKSEDLIDHTKVVVSYSDLRPDEVTESDSAHTDSFTEIKTVYERTNFSGQNSSGSALLSVHHKMTRWKRYEIHEEIETIEEEEMIAGGVIKTTTTTTTTHSLVPTWFYKHDRQEIIVSEWSPMKVIIYKEGDGNAAYDAMFKAGKDMGSFLPFIPLRRWGNFFGDDNFPTLVPWLKKAVKRSMDKKYSFIVGQLEDNDSIGDIDFAYLSYGVSLNTKEKAARKYVYKFFQAMLLNGAGGTAEYLAWRQEWQAANELQIAWAAWKSAQADSTNPLFGTPEPPQAIYPAQPMKNIRVYSDWAHYNINILWTGIEELTGLPGLGKPDAKKGDVWFVQGDQQNFSELLVSAGILDDRVIQSNLVTMYWQDKADSYRVLGVTGLHHTNIVYKGKGVDIDGIDALNDPEESGFIIPLHEGVMRSMSLKDATQMSTACSYMILNYYTVTKQRWYTKSWFKIVLIVAVIVVTIVTWGAGAPAGAGVLGTAASVGTAIGLAGTAAIIAGAAINAVAGMLIAQLIMQASVALLGPEVGAIVGAIASVAAVSMGTSLANGGTAMQGLQNISSALNLTKITVAASNGLATAQQGKLDEIQDKIQKLQDEYKDKMMEIYNAWTENLGFNKSTIDLQALTESAKVDHVYEQLDTFLSRTLMTGTDIANVTNGLISSYSEASLTTQLP